MDVTRRQSRRPSTSFSQSTSTEISSAPPSPLFSRRSSSSGTGDFAIIPPSHPARTLVLCFDSNSGLGRKYDTKDSNLCQFFHFLNRNDTDQQMCFCNLPSECRKPEYHNFWDDADVVLDKDFGSNLDFDVMAGYRRLVDYYRPGDKICLFGFSRGAYTARALAEVIHKVGLVPHKKATWVPFAYSLYLRDVDDRWHKLFERLRRECNPIKVSVDFIGVWDTVSSVGDVIPCTRPFTRSNTSIRVFRQALALHDRWARLHPKFYEFDTQDAEDRTDVQEVWFAGSHCDVGGCGVPSGNPHSLGRISLHWMVRECFRMNTGIQFQAERLRDIGLDPTSLYPVVKERPTPLQPHYHHFTTIAPRVPTASEEEHDVRDALSPMHEQLAVYAPLWWVMEFYPMRRPLPIGPPSEWEEGSEKTVRMTLPRGLFIPVPEHPSQFYVHPSVYIRQRAEHLREERF